jgi:hypothetical protein
MKFNRVLALATIALAAASCSSNSKPAPPRQEVAVLSALPLFWSEVDPTKAITQGDERAPIIRLLSDAFDFSPIDLADENGLKQFHLLILAQPALLAGRELVAIDNWVRGGGRVLVFADPELTWESPYPFGDPRAAPRVTLLDPLLTRWGLQLVAPNVQLPSGDASILSGVTVDTSTAGAWRSLTKDCTIADNGLRAICQIGEGRAELVADADILNLAALSGGTETNERAVRALLANWSKGAEDHSTTTEKEQGRNKLKE